MATSRRVGNYAQSAAAVTRSSNSIFDAAMSGKPDFTKISQEAIKGRSLERRAAAKAEGQVAQAAINAKAKVRGYEIAADAKKDVADIKRPARRMAGVVGALGTLAGAYVVGKGIKEDKKAAQEADDRFESYMERMEAAFEKGNDFTAEELPAPPQMETPELEPYPTSVQGSTNNTGSNVATNYQAPDGASTGMQYMEILTKDGFTPYQAAAITGQIDYESDGFRAMEEYTKNDYGTRGYGHLQWTNTPGSPRRDQFTSWVDSQQLEHSSVQANAGYLLHEMKNVPGIWTNGGSYQGMKGTKDLNSASDFMQFNYIRPKKATQNTPERRRRVQSYYDAWMSRNQ